jgi:signal transduction histidine kinase
VSALLGALSPEVSIAVVFTAYAVGRYEGRWPQRVGAALVGTVAVIQPWALATFAEFAGAVAGAAVAVVLPGALGALGRTRAALVAALTERAERAESEQETLAREAVLRERARIAREMHDVVGHRVSLMVLQAGAIEMAATDTERVAQMAAHVQAAGRQALDELRQMVGVLRGGDVDDAAPLGPQPTLEDLHRLVAQAREAGLEVTLSEPPEGAPPVPPGVGRAAFRIVQEGLTNAGKHAPGAAVRVAVERAPDQLVVRVVNGPPSVPAAGHAGGGFGLVGLGERVRTLGGRLLAEPRVDGGFVVEAVLPG